MKGENFNMSIKIDITIFLFLLIFCLTSQVEMYILLLLFALIHELGHLVTGLLLGFKPQEFNITPVGMKMEFKAKCEEYNKKVGKGNTLGIKNGIIAVAGPLTNFIMITLILTLINVNPELKTINLWNINYLTIIYANLLIGIFNLIPIYPLDGARSIKEILHIIFGSKKANIYIHYISKITIILLTAIASIAILYIQNISIVVILIYLWGIMIIESKRYHMKKKIQETIDCIKNQNCQ